MVDKYAEVIVENRAVATDRPYTYGIDKDMEDEIKEGMRVIVPFGNGNKNIKGIVIGINDNYRGEYRLKNIIASLDAEPLISENLIELSRWMKETYLSPYLDALRLVLPPGDFKKIKTFISLVGEKPNYSEDEREIVAYLKKQGTVEVGKMKKDLNLIGINNTIKELEDGKVIKKTIDISTRISKKTEKWVSNIRSDLSLDKKLKLIGNKAVKQRAIIEYMGAREEISLEEIIRAVNTSNTTVKALEDKDLVQIFDKEVKRNPIKREIDYYKKHRLNKEQEKVFLGIKEDSKQGFDKFLIHGVTASGKTEIYLQLVEEMLKENKDSIILVPEISLTPQTIDRFVGRFGEEVAVLHSGLSYGERFDQWRLIKEGKVRIAVGARSAVFAPFKNLGLIVIDEEHETTYKSSQNPKYNTIEVAEKRIELENGILLLGTATPSIETYYQAKNGHYKLYELKNRVNNVVLPKVEVVDMREELNNGNRSMFSQKLYLGIRDNLENKKQTILFLNRRGFSTFVSCRACGYVVACDDCDVSMTYHHNIRRVKCHYCGKTDKAPEVCPECGSQYIRYFGVGTERVEKFTRDIFPNARIARMDTDTMGNKGSYEKTLLAMKNGEIDILIGTQMISKGLDFKNVTLVGIIAADTTLNLPDFRSPERTFQLVTQVSGRAGRGDGDGRVVLQTYDPNHYSILTSREHDYKKFYELELGLRKEFLYPPFLDIMTILVYGENFSLTKRTIDRLGALLKNDLSWLGQEKQNNFIIGPFPAPLEKIKNNFRFQILLKIEKDSSNLIKRMVEDIFIENKYDVDLENVKISIDINPNSIL